MRLLRITLTLTLCALAGCSPSPKKETSASAPPAGPPSINLLAMGDWGSDTPTQKQVAGAMEDYVAGSRQDFAGALLLGDNFYTPLTGTDDPRWQSMFEEMYNPQILNFPFYVALGNHDYTDGKNKIERQYARENPQSRWKMPAPYYRIDIPENLPVVTILMLNSNKQAMTDAQWSAETYWIKTELARPRSSRWIVCAAHHPLFSNGDHGDNGVMQRDWGSLFKQYGVDLYICGHDHDLQHIEVPGWPMSFVLAGGGGQETKPIRIDQRGPFAKQAYGFAALSFSPYAIDVKLIDSDGSVLHEFRRSKAGTVQVVETSPSDQATTRTVGDITRGGLEETTMPSSKMPTTRMSSTTTPSSGWSNTHMSGAGYHSTTRPTTMPSHHLISPED